MIKFDSNKTKSLSVPVLVTGTDTNKLSFNFVIEVNNVKYGFPTDNQGDNIKIVIPPLNNIIKELTTGTYNAYIEANMITEDNKGFYMKPWNKPIEIINVPNIEMDIKEDITEEVKVSIPVIEEDIEEKIEDIKEEEADRFFESIPVKTKKVVDNNPKKDYKSKISKIFE